MPLVSVVIPTYNRAEFLSRAIESVLRQTVDDVELVVVDDASTDDTEAVVERFDDPRVEYVRHETNRGGSAARNTGIERSSGEYIAFLDSDDEWYPRKLERQVEELRSRSDEWVATYCGFEPVNQSPVNQFRDRLGLLLFGGEEKEYEREGGAELISDILSMRARLGGSSSLLVEADAVEAIDGFDESFRRHQDWEFLIRLLKVGKLAYTDETLLRKLQHNSASAESVESGKRVFLNKFADEVREAEANGIDVREIHMQHLTRAFCRAGKFPRAYECYRECDDVDARQVLRLGWYSTMGVLHRSSTALSRLNYRLKRPSLPGGE